MRTVRAAAIAILLAVSIPTSAGAQEARYLRCAQWFTTSRSVGWKKNDWFKLDYIIWRESRCLPHVRSTTRDTGLMQINDIHLSWLRAYGITQSSLYDPKTNLRAARLLYKRAERMFGCGWQPWGMC